MTARSQLGPRLIDLEGSLTKAVEGGNTDLEIARDDVRAAIAEITQMDEELLKAVGLSTDYVVDTGQ